MVVPDLNYNRMNVEKAPDMIEDGMRHLAFATELSIHQSKRGKSFALEHPASAASWQTETIHTLRNLPGVQEVEFDFCSLGMTSTNELGQAPVKKRTRIITKCSALAEELRRHQCTRDHRHLPLVHGRASACQEYPIECCKAVCRAVASQIDTDIKRERSYPRAKAVVRSISNVKYAHVSDAYRTQRVDWE